MRGVREVASVPLPAGQAAAELLRGDSERRQFAGESGLGLSGRRRQAFQPQHSVGPAGARSPRQESRCLARPRLFLNRGYYGFGRK